MSLLGPTEYCPHCKQRVLLVRKNFDICLALILLIFTAGIGLIVYLIIYYSQPKNRCIHCGTEINLLPSEFSNVSSLQSSQQAFIKNHQQVVINEDDNASYCPYCGIKLEKRKQKFCENCGSCL